MEGYTAKAIAQLAEWSGARLPTIGATPHVDDIDELPPPQVPDWLENDDESHLKYFWEFVASEQQHFRCVGLRLLARFTIC